MALIGLGLLLVGSDDARAQSVVAVGGSGADVGRAVAVDASGNAVVVGSFSGTVVFDPGTGIVSRTSSGGTDVFVARYAADGSLISVATVGGSGADAAYGVTLDASGNAVVVGSFSGTVDFDPGAGTTSLTSSGNADVFVARYAADGTFVSAFGFGGTGDDLPYDVALDGSNNAVVVGLFNGTADFDPSAGTTTSRVSSGLQDLFVARYTSSGTLVSVVTRGAAGNDVAVSVVVDASENAVVAGYFQNTINFDPGAGTANRTATVYDAFVARYASDGTFVSVFTYGGSGNDAANAIALDASGNVIVGGQFSTTVDFDPETGTTPRTSAGGLDSYVARYTSDGIFLSVVTAGGTGFDVTTGVAVDASGQIVMAGLFSGTVDFDPGAGTTSRTSAGGTDAYVARYTTGSALVSVATVGASGADEAKGVAIDVSNNAVVAGSFSGTVDFDPDAGTTSRTSNGSSDVFLARYQSSGALPVELAAFTAAADGPGAVRLAWTTAAETRNAGFQVEQAAAAGETWTPVGAFVPGHGTTSEAHSYALTLGGLAPGRHRFRLRQIDTDGTAHLSASVEVTLAAAAALEVHPSPARGAVRVTLAQATSAVGGKAVRVGLYDVLGREVARLHSGPVGDGPLVLAFDASSVPAGVYVVRAETPGGAVLTRTLVVSR